MPAVALKGESYEDLNCNHLQFLPIQKTCSAHSYVLVFGFATTWAQTYNESTSVSGGVGGTLTYQYQIQTGSCGGPSQTSDYTWESFSYTPPGGAAAPLSGTIWYLVTPGEGCTGLEGGWDSRGQGSTNGDSNQLTLSPALILDNQSCTITFSAYQGDASGNANMSCTPASTSTFDPLFKVTSILYSPPGNQSSQGYGIGTTNGTTTTTASTFTFSEELTFSSGIKDLLQGSASWGYSTGSGNSSAFTQTWANATNYASDGNKNSMYNPAASNALNHHLDTFEIWLNPQVTVTEYGGTPKTYAVSSQPITIDGEQVYLADVLPIPAMAMEAQPAGVTALNPSGVAGVSAVPVSDLTPVAIQQEDGTTVYQPGLGAICKSNTLYQQQLAADQATPVGQAPPAICTQANQCGCTPADFATIEERDTLLNYNSATYVGNPGNGTTTPLAADSSGEAVCGYNQPAGYVIPPGSNCRYVIVPEAGTNIPQPELLNGAQSLTYSQSDSTNSTFTTTSTQGYNTGFSFQVGDLLSSLRTTDTWTWTDTEGTGKSIGGTNTMNLTLQTSTANCSENANVYEDTIYHTYVFQIPPGNNCP